MILIQRDFNGEACRQQMMSLAQQYPEENLHVIDLPYRLSSWALDDPQNGQLWLDEDGQLVGWAVMQIPFWTIDLAYHPRVRQSVLPCILRWADQRARQLLDTPYGRPAWFIVAFERQAECRAELEHAGFADQFKLGEDSWSKVLMQRVANAPIPSSPLPDGFLLRPSAGEAEIQAFVELQRSVFESKNMTDGWRQRVLQRPEHLPELDLVITAPNGELAAFCVCWLATIPVLGGATGQVEPIGVLKTYQRLGLGRAILFEGLRRLEALGARQILVETDNYRNAALELYESAGFQVKEVVRVYRKDYEASHEKN